MAGGAVPRGDLLRYRVAGLPPTVPVAIELHSEPVTLLRTRSDARGVVDVSFRVPRDAPAGDHQIVAVAVDPATGTVVAIPTPIRLSSDVRDIVLDQHPWWLVTGVGAAATLAAAIELSARRRGRRRGSPARCYPR